MVVMKDAIADLLARESEEFDRESLDQRREILAFGNGSVGFYQKTATGLTGEPQPPTTQGWQEEELLSPSSAQTDASASRSQFCPCVSPISTTVRQCTASMSRLRPGNTSKM